MSNIDLSKFSPLQLARANAALDSLVRINGQVTTWRAHIEAMETVSKTETDGMCDWSRTRFNRMDHREQAAYEARLKAKRYYHVNGWQVAKLVYDATLATVTTEALAA